MIVEPAGWEVAAADRAIGGVAGEEPRCGPIRVLAIDGRSGAGKSVLASRIAEVTGAPLVALDELYPGWDGLQRGLNVADLRILEPLAAGDDAAAPTWDWATSEPIPDGFTLSHERVMASGGLIILEGCGAGVAPLARWASWRTWLACDEAIRRRRALARDGDTYAGHWDQWARQEDAIYAGDDPEARAHQIVRVPG